MRAVIVGLIVFDFASGGFLVGVNTPEAVL
jgi:hypothetical protein